MATLNPLEAEEQRALVSCSELRPWGPFFFHLPNERAVKIEAYKLKRQGVKRGLPDNWLIKARYNEEFNVTRCGLVMELKRRLAVPSEVSLDQWMWLGLCAQAGFLSVVCCGAEQGIQALDEYWRTGAPPQEYKVHPQYEGVWIPSGWKVKK